MIGEARLDNIRRKYEMSYEDQASSELELRAGCANAQCFELCQGVRVGIRHM